MKTAPLPRNEKERLGLLKRLEALDATREEIFDAVTRSIALICDVPVTLIHLADRYRLLFEPNAATDGSKKTREATFCAEANLSDEILIVSDTLRDKRFKDNPLVNETPNIRFFESVPLMLAPKIRLGSLCVIDYLPRTLNERQQELLELLAGHVVSIFRLLLDKSDSVKEYRSLVLAKHRLQFQKDLNEAILDNEPEGVMVLSRQGELEQINKAGLDMLEADSLEEARSKKLIDYVLPEYRERLSELETRVFNGERLVNEYKISSARGTERWIESHAAPLYNRQGQAINLIAISRDITDTKKAEERLALAARVFADAQEGIIITDARSVIVDVNPAFCNITGYSREEIIGKTPKILQSGLQGPDFYADLWKTLIQTGHWKGEIWSRKKNGELYAELISINALHNASGNTTNYVALFIDISDYKRQQGLTPEVA
ncbi:MAG: PAS domain S-box protein [Gallionellaceae bacterium]